MIRHKTIRRFAVLSGARRVEKTTIICQMIDALIEDGISLKKISYVFFDNSIVKLVDIETVLSLYDSMRLLHWSNALNVANNDLLRQIMAESKLNTLNLCSELF